VYWTFKLITGKEGMGYGDFKLLGALGAWLGWQMLLPIIVIASGLGAIVGLYVMYRQRKGRDMQIAFGPFLAIAGWIALVAGHDIVGRYLGLFALPA
jgi:leader peptidase (prepilin peptidase)/N-methyltransferase